MTSERLACLGIDMDEVALYAALHGVPLDGACPPGLVHSVAGRRFGELCEGAGLRGTVFVVGRALRESAPAEEAVRLLHRSGHEVANHTLGHDYRLTRRDDRSLEEEVAGGAEAVRLVTGEPPVGFRAPGYNLSGRLLEALGRNGCSYDSSILPSLPYYAGRVAAIGLLALAGRRSVSMAGSAASCLAPRAPYFPSLRAVWRRGSSPVVELPLTTTPVAGLPFIGTLVAAAPPRLVARIVRGLASRPFLNVGLHGLDLMDATDGVPRALLGLQPGLGLPAAEKMRRFSSLLARMKEAWQAVPLAEAAAAYRRSAPPGEAPGDGDRDGGDQPQGHRHGPRP